MKRSTRLSWLGTAVIGVLGYFTLADSSVINDRHTVAAAPRKVTQGALQAVGNDGKARGDCPLKRTDVRAEISGSLARVNVVQEFQNPFSDKIEAVYVFPLPVNAAVDEMTMLIGDRTVKGKIKRREEARAVYEAAREAGQVAALLDQERPNIFTQAVANIMPGATVKVMISYVEVLKYEAGTYEFVFPMVVGPRYIPGAPMQNVNQANQANQGGGFAPDTSQVPDASRITPQVTPEGTRAGHDIAVEVKLDAGVAIDSLDAPLHEVELARPSPHEAVVRLKDGDTIPNKDFILKFDVASKKIADAILTHRSQAGGFFTMILQPPERVTAADVMPKELVFVLDTSGSMSGFPIEKAKETMKLALDALYPQDTFNLITFAGDTHILFNEPVHATPENLRRAQAFLATRAGSGGTEMMKAIRASLDTTDEQGHVRIVCFMTDGYVGNDLEIIGEVQKHPNARVFSFGIGNSVNRFLLDKMAEHGRGEVEYVSLNDDGSAAARRFHERVRNPLLTDIEVDWSGLPVADVYPQRIPDLFGAKPVILSGRYTAGARGVIRLKGRTGGRDFVREIPVELPEAQPQHDVLATLWARTRIDQLMAEDFNGIQQGNAKPEIREAITQLGLEYRLLTQFTSFVAVEEMSVTDGGKPRRIDVPVEMPEGVSYEGVFGRRDEMERKQIGNLPVNGRAFSSVAQLSAGIANQSAASAPVAKEKKPAEAAKGTGGGVGTGQGAGVGAGRGGNVGGGSTSTGGSAGRVEPQAATPPPPMVLSPQTLGGPQRINESAAADKDERARSLDDEKRRQISAKLHPAIAAVIERLKTKGAAPSAAELKFVRHGKAEIQLHLTVKSAEIIAQLKQLGFEVVLDPSSSKLIVGRLPLEKLAALAELTFVRYVAPQAAN